MATQELLRVEELEVFYGGIQALHGVSLEVRAGEIVTLIGANGAGKSTTLAAISGLVPPKRGRVVFEGKELTGLPAHQVARGGISLVPEGRRIFPNLSVRENLLLGAYVRTDRGQVQEDLREVFTLFPRLAGRSGQVAGTLSGGEQQMLAMGRALMARPRLLLLDEPSLGLAPFLVKEVFRWIGDIKARGTTVLLVEQNARMALAVADRGYVLETGRIVLAGTAPALSANPQVQHAYLGE
jgi:branched-chain amino acid transport system ATP-binding protein